MTDNANNTPPANDPGWIEFQSSVAPGAAPIYLRRDAIAGVKPETNTTSSVIVDGLAVVVAGTVQAVYQLIRQ